MDRGPELLSEGIDNPLTGAAKLQLLGETFSGTIAHAPDNQDSALSGNSGGFVMARVVGGAGGMQTAVDPKEWAQGATVSMILTELLTRAGETQALDIDPAILVRTLPQWSYPAGTVETALSALTAYLGIVWRIRRDGRVWLGKRRQRQRQRRTTSSSTTRQRPEWSAGHSMSWPPMSTTSSTG